jgi:hypothetical protein
MADDTKCSPSCNSASEAEPSHSIEMLTSGATEGITRTLPISAPGYHSLAARIAVAIDPTASPVSQDLHLFEIRHALRIRIHELERDVAILKSRLRARHR